MKFTHLQRKKTHIALFLAIIIVQIIVFLFWYNQNSEQKKLQQVIENANKPNLALGYSNFSTKYFLEANNNFNDYLQNYNPISLKKYNTSINQMTIYLDSLSMLANVEKSFYSDINDKKNIEKQVVALKKQLDFVLKSDFEPMKEKKESDLNVQKFDYNNILKSISYDTIKTEQKAKKKGLFGRIGGALSGKNDQDKEKVEIKIKMQFGNEIKSGNFEDQIKNVFQSTESYYKSEFDKVKNNYFSLNAKDKELIMVNKSILKNSQKVIVFYSKSANEAAKIKYQTAINQYYTNIENQKSLILMLMGIMLFCTLLLLGYSYFGFKNEKKLYLAERNAQKNIEFKNRIIGMLSHEMRAPLNIIANITHKLKSKNNNQDEKINQLYFTSNSLKITVTQILDFFKNENSKLVLYNTNVNLYNETTSILESLKSIAEQKNIEIIYNIDQKLNQDFWVDYGKIHQLFYNIIGNAIKFTEKGNVTTTIKLIDNNKQPELKIIIKDTGVGIPPEDVDKVFDKYYQSKNTKEQISFGAGLGLNLCKEIISLYHGEIEVKSQINQGTEISFNLLLDNISEFQKTFKDKLIEKNAKKSLNIAVVDDDKIILSIIKKQLSEAGIIVATFDNALLMEQYLQSNLVDIVITDLQIAAITGKEMISKIKTLNNQNNSVPIIAISSDNSITENDLKILEANTFIVKPINKEELYDKILTILG